jgi:KDO2-lipid IV(A) lauroyltransferase
MTYFFSWMIKQLFSRLPLKWIHYLGHVFGIVFHCVKPKISKVLAENLRQSLPILSSARTQHTTSLAQAIRLNQSEAGKTMMESFAIWASPPARVLQWIVHVKNAHVIDEAHQRKHGIIFITPHLGAYEITSIYYGTQYPITVLYRRPRKEWLFNMIVKGRAKGKIKVAETNAAGVKQLLSALKKGEAVGILPDQIASRGQGEWADFFGRPAYTMVLLSKLALKTNASIIMAVGERLPNSQGFTIHLKKLTAGDVSTPQRLNRALEQEIKQWPLQYMWNYDRFKALT